MSAKRFNIGIILCLLIPGLVLSGCSTVTPTMQAAHQRAVAADLSCVKDYCFAQASKQGASGVESAIDEYALECMPSHVSLYESAGDNLALNRAQANDYIHAYDGRRNASCRESAQQGLDAFCRALTDKKAELTASLEKAAGRSDVDSTELSELSLTLANLRNEIDSNCP